ncbi:hypothetical protein GALL_226210 [mine drainage metagenome]|uniref:Transporter n=1 Tax=mine drainage metagenome TaxID=410659 RepID=A0A1J5RHU5_9ZZZZ
MRMRMLIPAAALLAAPVLSPTAALACATCGCTLDTDDLSAGGGASQWRADLQYTYIDQSQLRSGGHAVSSGAVAAINDNGGSQEVEQDTRNTYLTLGLAYSPTPDWSIATQLPYVFRGHSTYGNASRDQLNADSLSSANFAQLGDVRVVGNYQGLLPTHALGLELGVKLPTGAYGGQDTRTGATVGHPVNFSSGPNAGSPMDTSLQPGTGSTDIILGASYAQAISQDFDAYINGRFQAALLQELNSANETYRPGNTTTISLGLRYEHSPLAVPQLQLNLTHRSADQGALADTTDTAGTVGYLSPGLTLRLGQGLHAYGFVQVPVFSHLDGYQLFPRWTASAGLSYAF